MRELCKMTTKKGDRIGSRAIKSITPRGADKIYDCLTLGPKVQDCQPRRRLCFSVAKLGGSCIDFIRGVQQGRSESPMKTRVKLTKPAATREQVHVFAQGCIERGEVECG